MEKDHLTTLTHTICNAVDDAMSKSVPIKGKDVVMLIGCTGSGKTTVTVYSLGAGFECHRGRLSQTKATEGFDIGDCRASVTSGLSTAEVPNGEQGLYLVDFAGTGDTAGLEAELSGAIYRSAVMQAARTVRIALVMSLDRTKVSNGRGVHAVRDVEHVAALFKKVTDYLDSIGMIVTSDPAYLINGNATSGILAEIIDAMEDLDKQCQAEGSLEGMKTTEAGVALLQHLHKNCQAAQNAMQEAEDQFPDLADEDELILSKLSERQCAVYPINVLQDGQRSFFHQFLTYLKPVTAPMEALALTLPYECENELQSILNEEFSKTRSLLGCKSVNWASDEKLVSNLFNLLKLSNILEENHILPWAADLKGELCQLLIGQNKAAVALVLESVAVGNIGKLAIGLEALRAMDHFSEGFLKRLPPMDLTQWSSLSAAICKGVEQAREAVAEFLPTDLCEAKWDSFRAKQLYDIFVAVEKLEEPGVTFLHEWAVKLTEHVLSFKATAAQCANAKTVVQAMSRLEELKELFPNSVAKVLSKYGGQKLVDEGMDNIVKETKVTVHEQLQSISDKMVRDWRQSPQACPAWEQLQQLCKSTELNTLLDENLEQIFIMQPLSAAAPTQDELNSLQSAMEHSSSDEWYSELLDLTQRVSVAGKFGVQMLEAGNLQFEALLNTVRDKVANAFARVKETTAQFRSASVMGTSTAPGRFSIISGCSGHISDDDLPMDDETDEAEHAIDELVMLLKADSLVLLLGRPSADTAAKALKNTGWNLKTTLKELLKKVRKARDMTWMPFAAVESELCKATVKMKAPVYVARHAFKHICNLDGGFPGNLCESLKEAIDEADGVITSMVTRELEVWDTAVTDVKEWPETFSRCVRNAQKLQYLAPQEVKEVVREAHQKLYQKATVWREHLIQEVERASEEKEKWQDFITLAVCKGMEFEESSLFDLFRFRIKFRPLVETQAKKWQEAAAVAQNNAKFAAWQKLTALMSALERLGKQDERTMKLLKDVAASRAPLDADMQDTEFRIKCALKEERYFEVYRLIGGIQNSSRHVESLKDNLLEAVEKAVTNLSAQLEADDMLRAVTKAHDLIQDIEKCQDKGAQDMLVLLEAPLTKLKAALASKGAIAADDLQLALDGQRPPMHALKVASAFRGKSRIFTADEAVCKFICAKKRAFPEMNCDNLAQWIIRHDGARRAMPEELGSNTAYEDLIRDFIERFKSAFKKEKELVGSYKCQRKWGDAKRLNQGLRDVIDSVLELEILKPFKAQLKNQRSLLGVGGAERTKIAKEEIGHGKFDFAIRTLLSGDAKDIDEICETIHIELNKNMDLADNVSKRLPVLKSFLDSVGDHPPDELAELCGEVRASYERKRPMVEQEAMKAVEVGVEAASGSDLDIARLARALVEVHQFEGVVTESQRKEFDEAVQNFWQRVRQVIVKVGKDIEGLEVQSLSLNLEPLRLWLGGFSNLKAEEKKVLLDQLQSGTTDLQVWMREVLAEPLGRLLDANTVQHEMESRNFIHISRRCKVAQKLQQVLSTAPLDLQPVRTRVHQVKDAALGALKTGTLQGFNSEYKILKTVSSDLPELHVNESLDEVERVFNKTVLDVQMRRVSSAQTIPDARNSIVDLRNVANDAPDTYEIVNPCLQVALKKLESTPAFNTRAINQLGGVLGRDNVGRLVISEHAEIFGAAKDMRNNAIFRRAGETNDSSEVVGRLCSDSDLAASDRTILEDVLKQYEENFDRIAEKYLMHGKPIGPVLQEAKTDLDMAVAAYTNGTQESSIKLLAHLAACYTVIKCGKLYIEASIEEQQNCLVKPHRAQILTICRLLQINKKHSFLSRVCRSSTQKKPENHLAQVLTGEGKCLTLGLLASFLVLTGMECDIVCYRKFLTEQDSQAMEPFYKFVGIDDKIRYATFDELCQERLDSIKGASKDLLLTGQTCRGRKLRNLSQRALLIDEVDVFFGRRFYGQTWDGGFTLDSPEAVSLVRFIFERMRSCGLAMDITVSQPFKELLSKCPLEMHQALTGTALMLQSSIDGWATPEPILNERTGQIGYKDGDEVNYDISYSNKTVFAYLNYEMEGKITPQQAEKHLGVDLFCGRFSFAEFPKEYCCILGVTGTLRELLTFPLIKKMLEQEYSFKHFTYTPSIFGETRLTFKEAEHVKVSDNESDWLSSIERQIAHVKGTKNSGLIFFKNEAQLKKLPNYSNYECMTERLDPGRRAGYVAAATTEGRITLLTRAFGRGIDFQMPDGHEVVVVQTFLSSLISEQTQIKGRTARQGKSGQYRLELCKPHLEAKMGFNTKEIQILKSGSGEEIKGLLQSKQKAKTEVKATGMSQRKEKAAQLERETRDWENLLFNTSAPHKDKLTHLAQWNGNEVFKEVHYHLLLDNSYSMNGQPWQELTRAFRRFLQELQRDPAAAATTKVSVTLFNGMAHTVCPTHAKISEVQDIGHHQPSNGTSFHVAFTECSKVLTQSSPYAREILLFLTDGIADVPDRAISDLLVSHKSRIKNLTCIAFGDGADASSLRQIGQLFQAHGICFKLTTPGDQASLVQTFVEAAKSRAIHT